MIFATNQYDLEMFCQVLNYAPTPGFRGMKQVIDDKIYAMVGWDRWTPNSVEAHIVVANPRGMTKQFLVEIFKYAFITANKKLIVGITRGNNEESLEFNRRVGFTEKYRIVDGWEDGVDMVVQEMRKDECRWIRSIH